MDNSVMKASVETARRAGTAVQCVMLVVAAFLVAGCKQNAPEKMPSQPPASTESRAARAEPAPPPAVPFKGLASGAGFGQAAPNGGDRIPKLEFAVPQTVAVGKSDEVSFVIQGASIEPRNPESVRLVLLMRLNNRSAYGVNFWDSSFRLITHNATIPASGGLNVLVDGRSDSALEKVQFVVPLSSAPRALKIEFGGEAVELPLRFLG